MNKDSSIYVKQNPSLNFVEGGEMKRVAREENELVVGIPPLVWLGVVPTELELDVVSIQLEHVRKAIMVEMYTKPSVPPQTQAFA